MIETYTCSVCGGSGEIKRRSPYDGHEFQPWDCRTCRGHGTLDLDEMMEYNERTRKEDDDRRLAASESDGSGAHF